MWIEKAFLYAERSKNVILKEQSNFKTLGELHPKNKDLKIQKELISKQEVLINVRYFLKGCVVRFFLFVKHCVLKEK